jgi:hypothetical protein
MSSFLSLTHFAKDNEFQCTILDSGANRMFFPHFNPLYMSNYTPSSTLGSVKVANSAYLPIIATANLGVFTVSIVPGLSKPLISESYLTTHFFILIIRYENVTWILDSVKAAATIPKDYILAKATMDSDDGLFYLDNIFDLVNANPKPRTKESSPKVHFSPKPPQTYHTSEQLNRGRYQGRFSHLLGKLNPLEVMHTRLGHHTAATLKYMVKHNIVDGLGVTAKELKDITLGPCFADYAGRMKAFPVYSSLTDHSKDKLFETWSVDDVPMPVTSIEGYNGYFSLVEKKTRYREAYGYKQSISELPLALDKLIFKLGPRSNHKCKPMKILILDGSKTNLGSSLEVFCQNISNPSEPVIKRYVSAPYKHQQNLSESNVQQEKNNMRINLAYNQAPSIMWFKSLKYGNRNSNLSVAPNTKISRHEAMTGLRPDVSHYVPFYAVGYAHSQKDTTRNALSDRAIRVRMIGYGDDLDDQSYPNTQYKQSYQCFIPPNKMMIRHDVIWEHLAPEPSLLNPKFKDRFKETFDSEHELYEELTRRFDPNESNQQNKEAQNPSHNVHTPTDVQPELNHVTPPQDVTAFPNSLEDAEQIDLDRDRHSGLRRSTRTANHSEYTPYSASMHPATTYEPEHWYDNMIHHNQMSSPIFDPNNNQIPLSVQSEGSNPPSISPPTTAHSATEWLNALLAHTANHSVNTQSDLSHTSTPHNLVRSDGVIEVSNDPLPHQVINDIMHDYNRVIRNILITHKISKDTEFYSASNSDMKNSYYSHPSKRNSTTPQAYSARNTSQQMEEDLYNPQPPIREASIIDASLLLHVPLTLGEALAGKDGEHWREAWQLEMHRLSIRNTWEPTTPNSVPQNTKPIRSKYIFKIKSNPDGTFRYKVRLVACGYSQKHGIDYDDTFAPTAKYKSLCTVLTLAASQQWHITGIDVENAFVEADIDRPLYMHLPTQTYKNTNGSPVTVKLLKSLYGLKQAPELWDKLLVSAINSQGFKQCMHDQCVFVKIDNQGNKVIIVKYVDDLIITGNSQPMISTVLDGFSKSFTKITHDDTIQRYVGIDLDYNRANGTILLSQKPYIRKILSRFGINPDEMLKDPTRTPLNPNLNYRLPGDGTNKPMRDLVGNIRFLADRTLPNILASCSLLGSAAHNPTPTHISGGEHALRYLHTNQNDYIKLGGDPHINLFGYADAAHISGNDSKSQLGYCFYLNLNSGAVVAKSKKDATVSHSSTEAEIKAIDLAIKEATWLRGFLTELGHPQQGPTTIFTDNKAAAILSETNNTSDMTNHLVLRINYIHQERMNGTIKLQWINTENNVADILTKALPYPSYRQHSETLMHGHSGITPSVSSFTNRDKKRKKNLSKSTSPLPGSRKKAR